MIIDSVRIWFHASDYPHYVLQFKFEDGGMFEQSVYDNPWGRECLSKIFGLDFPLDINFYSDNTLDEIREVAKDMKGAECGLITTKRNYRFLKIISLDATVSK